MLGQGGSIWRCAPCVLREGTIKGMVCARLGKLPSFSDLRTPTGASCRWWRWVIGAGSVQIGLVGLLIGAGCVHVGRRVMWVTCVRSARLGARHEGATLTTVYDEWE